MDNKHLPKYHSSVFFVSDVEKSKTFYTELIGQKIEMTFKLPNYNEAFKLNGHISRSGPKGIGIKFYGLTQSQEEFVRSFIESKQ